jgi:exoribonuclease R
MTTTRQQIREAAQARALRQHERGRPRDDAGGLQGVLRTAEIAQAWTKAARDYRAANEAERDAVALDHLQAMRDHLPDLSIFEFLDRIEQ